MIKSYASITFYVTLSLPFGDLDIGVCVGTTPHSLPSLKNSGNRSHFGHSVHIIKKDSTKIGYPGWLRPLKCDLIYDMLKKC